jgi:hypothetical protein
MVINSATATPLASDGPRLVAVITWTRLPTPEPATTVVVDSVLASAMSTVRLIAVVSLATLLVTLASGSFTEATEAVCKMLAAAAADASIVNTIVSV